MRKILLFMTLGCSILLGACSDVEVGYLVSDMRHILKILCICII